MKENSITIQGTKYVLVDDIGDETCESCDLFHICKDSICNDVFGLDNCHFKLVEDE